MRQLTRLIAQALIVCMVWTPFSLQAGMIGTDQVVASSQDQANRDKVFNFVQRGDVAKQFEVLGLSSASAKDRVNAMTPDEINRIAGKIDSLPAGAADVGVIVVVLVIGAIIWYVWFRR